MTCEQCQAILQQRLDERRPTLTAADVADHLAGCRHCRDLYDLSESSWSGVRVSPFHKAPEDFAEKVLKRAGHDRRRREQHWVLLALALSLLLTLGLGAFLLVADVGPTELPQVRRTPSPRQPPPNPDVARLLRQAEGLAGAPRDGLALTRDIAEQASWSARKLLPGRLPLATSIADPVDASLKPVRQVGVTLASSFRPVANSAERAFQEFRDWLPKQPMSEPDR